MSVFLNNISGFIDSGEITISDALYLIFLKEEVVFTIEEPRLAHLVANKFIKGNRPGSKMYVEKAAAVTGTVAPKFTNDISKEVYKYICKRVCLQAASGDIALLGGDTEITETSSKYLLSEDLLVFPYMLFLYLFPSEKIPNLRWEKHFIGGEKYSGMPLRHRNVRSGKKFVSIAKSKDMGAFILGTYRYIQSTIRDGKAFVTTVPKYLKAYDDWYSIALIDINKAKRVSDLFKEGIDTGVRGSVL